MSKEKGTVYRFRDTDDTGWEEYDISGEDYSKLIDICLRYCCTFSFEVTRYLGAYNDLLEKFDGAFIRTRFVDVDTEERFYELTQEVAEELKKVSDSIFSWSYPQIGAENLTFYREDGSVFLKSVTHDGICDIFPESGEDISSIISRGVWEKDPKPVTFDFAPKSSEWIEQHNRELLLIKEEKNKN